MSDQVLHQTSNAHDPALEHGSSDRTYVMVAIFLAVMTALEVSVSYTKDALGPFHDWLLIVLMAIKFFVVCFYFMHLKNDPKMCQRVFFFGLGIASVVYVMMLGTFHFWATGYR